MTFGVNDRVRVRTAPDKEGRITGKTRERGGRTRYQVDFGNCQEYVLETNLEQVPELQDVYDLLEAGNYGGVVNLRTVITHRRLTGRLADVVYSMEATNTEFYPYQFKPVLNFLDSPSRGILIADEVGLGKTIEAGLIWTELRARMDADRLLVLCPAMLREKWKEELAHRFGVNAEICSAKEMHEILQERKRNNLRGFAAIASLQGMRPPRGWEDDSRAKTATVELANYLLENELEDALFDCVIVDEAHYLRNPNTQTHKLVRLLRPVSESLILLSATPIQLRSADLFHLLNLIDEESFRYLDAFDEILEANQPLIELSSRLRESPITQGEFTEAVGNCLANNLLQNNRQLQYMRDNPPVSSELQSAVGRENYANRIERVNLLARVVNRSRKRDVQQNRVVREPYAPSIPMSPLEQKFYGEVTDSVREYCLDRDLAEGFILTIPQRQMCSSMPAALRAWNRKLEQYADEELVYETTGYENGSGKKLKLGPLVQQLAENTGRFATFKELKADDSKYSVLRRTLQDYWKGYPDKKVIIFSYYRETLRYLRERMVEDGLECMLIYGGMKESKHEMINRFRKSNSIRVLLASEVASEGVDLQFCSFIINYDLPWNPMRVEQRIGRIDRIGQQEDRINIHNFFYADTLDDRIYQRLYDRLDVFRFALGDLEAVLGEKIRQLTHELLTHKLNEKQENERIRQTEIAIARQRREQEELEKEAAQLAAHGDYVLNKVRAAREMRRYIDGEHLWIYVRDFLESRFPGSSLVRMSDHPLEVDIQLTRDAKVELRHFLDSTRYSGTTRLMREAAGELVKCVFSNHADFSDSRHEIINQYHPLVRFVTSSLAENQFYPLVSAKIGLAAHEWLRKGTYLFVVNQWSTQGARSIEKLVYKGMSLTDNAEISDELAERLVSTAVANGSDWPAVRGQLDYASALEHYESLVDVMDDEFQEYARQMEMQNSDQVDYLVRVLLERKESQVKRNNEIIERLKSEGKLRTIKAREGSIRKLEETLDLKIAQYEKQRTISTNQRNVIAGVIHVA